MVTDKPAITVIFYSSSPSLPFHFKPGLVQIVEFAHIKCIYDAMALHRDIESILYNLW